MSDPIETKNPVTPDDLENKLRGIKAQVDDKTNAVKSQAQSKLIPAGIAAGVLLFLIAYIIGRRIGDKTSSVVEIRRI